MRFALHAEWTKLRTVSGTVWLFVAAIVITVVVGAASTGSINADLCPSPSECVYDTTKLTFAGVWLGQVAVVVLATLAMTNEYGTRMMQITLAANPRRTQVLTAKATVITAIVLVAGTVAVLGSLIVGRANLHGNGLSPANGFSALSLTEEPTLRAAAGTVLYLGLIGLLSLGAGTIIRDTAGTITAVLGVLFAVPIVTQFVSDPQWSERLRKLAPMTAGLAIQSTRGLGDLPIGPWGGLGVLAVYAGAVLLLGAIVFKLRDA